jgi:hypothetical protein
MPLQRKPLLESAQNSTCLFEKGLLTRPHRDRIAGEPDHRGIDFPGTFLLCPVATIGKNDRFARSRHDLREVSNQFRHAGECKRLPCMRKHKCDAPLEACVTPAPGLGWAASGSVQPGMTPGGHAASQDAQPFSSDPASAVAWRPTAQVGQSGPEASALRGRHPPPQA